MHGMAHVSEERERGEEGTEEVAGDARPGGVWVVVHVCLLVLRVRVAGGGKGVGGKVGWEGLFLGGNRAADFSILRIGKGTARGYGSLGCWKCWVGIIGQRSVAKRSLSGESSCVQRLPRFWC